MIGHIRLQCIFMQLQIICVLSAEIVLISLLIVWFKWNLVNVNEVTIKLLWFMYYIHIFFCKSLTWFFSRTLISLLPSVWQNPAECEIFFISRNFESISYRKWVLCHTHHRIGQTKVLIRLKIEKKIINSRMYQFNYIHIEWQLEHETHVILTRSLYQWFNLY